MRKKLFSFVFVTVILLMIFTLHALSSDYLNAVALGDSITVGYGLSKEEESYVEILKKEDHLKMNTIANVGDASVQLLKHLGEKKNQNLLKKSDLVFINIGANDMLSQFLSCVADTLSIQDRSGDLSDTILRTIQKDPIRSIGLILPYFQQGTRENNALLQQLDTSLTQFESNYEQIITTVEKYAPNSRIFVCNIYNPFQNVKVGPIDFGGVSGQVIRQFNEVIEKKAAAHNLPLVDIYTAFENYSGNEPLTKTDILSGNLDPHPTAAGHRLIATSIQNALQAENIQVKPTFLFF